MFRQPLGHTGLDVTRLGYGSMGLRGPRTWGVRTIDDPTAEMMLNAVLDAGINFIDTVMDSWEFATPKDGYGNLLIMKKEIE